MKDTAALQFGSFLSVFSNEHRNAPPINHQQRCLINGICGTLDIKSNYFDPSKRLKKVLKNWVRGDKGSVIFYFEGVLEILKVL